MAAAYIDDVDPMIVGQVPLYNQWNCPFCWYGARFYRESDFVTYVTVVRSTAVRHATTVQARLLTFYDRGIAYVDYVTVCDYAEVEDVGYCIEMSSVLPIVMKETMMPPGISEIRDPTNDNSVLLEVFLMVRASLASVQVSTPLKEALDVNNILPLDIVKTICCIAHEDVTKNLVLQDAIAKPIPFPFKVQHKYFWSRRPEYRVVEKGRFSDASRRSWMDFN